ncbi:hypothetical protein HS7_19950 [Sulfolobales archaeon HS-7]|nr:hypothetical protein HS7_19950 [Sulfolobales archaeon HS-7]
MLNELAVGILYYLPAFIANGGATFVRKGKPIDFGKFFIDSNRILGDGKTLEGTLVGTTFGIFFSIGEVRIFGLYWIAIGAGVSMFALLGDIAGAFIKRRLKIERGGRAPILDQLDFVLGATVFLLLSRVNLTIYQIGLVCVLALILHVLTNRVAYRLKIKSVPW